MDTNVLEFLMNCSKRSEKSQNFTHEEEDEDEEDDDEYVEDMSTGHQFCQPNSAGHHDHQTTAMPQLMYFPRVSAINQNIALSTTHPHVGYCAVAPPLLQHHAYSQNQFQHRQLQISQSSHISSWSDAHSSQNRQSLPRNNPYVISSLPKEESQQARTINFSSKSSMQLPHQPHSPPTSTYPETSKLPHTTPGSDKAGRTQVRRLWHEPATSDKSTYSSESSSPFHSSSDQVKKSGTEQQKQHTLDLSASNVCSHMKDKVVEVSEVNVTQAIEECPERPYVTEHTESQAVECVHNRNKGQTSTGCTITGMCSGRQKRVVVTESSLPGSECTTRPMNCVGVHANIPLAERVSNPETDHSANEDGENMRAERSPYVKHNDGNGPEDSTVWQGHSSSAHEYNSDSNIDDRVRFQNHEVNSQVSKDVQDQMVKIGEICQDEVQGNKIVCLGSISSDLKNTDGHSTKNQDDEVKGQDKNGHGNCQSYRGSYQRTDQGKRHSIQDRCQDDKHLCDGHYDSVSSQALKERNTTVSYINTEWNMNTDTALEEDIQSITKVSTENRSTGDEIDEETENVEGKEGDETLSGESLTARQLQVVWRIHELRKENMKKNRESKTAGNKCRILSGRASRSKKSWLLQKFRYRTYSGMMNLKGKILTCALCGFSTDVFSKLEIHLKLHLDGKAFKCDLCDYASSNPHQLKLHLKVHSDIKDYLCTECGYTTKWYSQFRQHIMKHSKADMCICSICGHMSYCASRLSSHMRTHSETKQYHCSECSYTSKRKQHLKRHMLNHTKEKLFSCDVCHAAFTTAYHLKYHKYVHTGEKPYRCRICDYACKQSTSLKLHVKKHHGCAVYQCDQCSFSCDHALQMRSHSFVHADSSCKSESVLHVERISIKRKRAAEKRITKAFRKAFPWQENELLDITKDIKIENLETDLDQFTSAGAKATIDISDQSTIHTSGNDILNRLEVAEDTVLNKSWKQAKVDIKNRKKKRRCSESLVPAKEDKCVEDVISGLFSGTLALSRCDENYNKACDGGNDFGSTNAAGSKRANFDHASLQKDEIQKQMQSSEASTKFCDKNKEKKRNEAECERQENVADRTNENVLLRSKNTILEIVCSDSDIQAHTRVDWRSGALAEALNGARSEGDFRSSQDNASQCSGKVGRVMRRAAEIARTCIKLEVDAFECKPKSDYLKVKGDLKDYSYKKREKQRQKKDMKEQRKRNRDGVSKTKNQLKVEKRKKKGNKTEKEIKCKNTETVSDEGGFHAFKSNDIHGEDFIPISKHANTSRDTCNTLTQQTSDSLEMNGIKVEDLLAEKPKQIRRGSKKHGKQKGGGKNKESNVTNLITIKKEEDFVDEPLKVSFQHAKTSDSSRHTSSMNRCKVMPHHSIKKDKFLPDPFVRHMKQGCFTCVLCNSVFERLIHLRKHMEGHDHPPLYTCHLCPMAFWCIRGRRIHTATHKGEDGRFHCLQCPLSFTYAIQLHLHLDTHGEKNFKCDQCSFATRKAEYLVSHMAVHGSTKQYLCALCGFSCAWRYRYRRHMREHTGKPILCQTCGYTTYTQSVMVQHLKTHSTTDRHICPECGMSFKRKGHLRRHQHLHAKDKKLFSCEHCDFTTHQAVHLRIHTYRHTGEKPYKCMFCDYACRQSNSLKQHMRTWHNTELYRCEYCEYSTSTKLDLRRHKMSHTSEMKFDCQPVLA